jgi:hypothetical protein
VLQNFSDDPYCLQGYVCPLTAIAISRGVVDKNDPRLELQENDNPVPAWACDEFGEIWFFGFVNGFDETEKTNDESEYLAGYELGVLARGQVFRRQA